MRNSGGELEINVEVSTLIEALKNNRDNHIKEFNSAKIAYFEKLNTFLTEIKKDFEDNILRKDEYKHRLHQPINKSEDYNKLIKMLVSSTDKTLTLTKSQYDEFVHDEWHWINNAKTVNSMYLSN